MNEEPVGPRDGQDRLTTDAADIVVFSQKWDVDQPGEGDRFGAQIHVRILINGVEVPWATGVTVRATNDFTAAVLEVLTRTIQFVPLDPDDWEREDLSPLVLSL